MKCVEWRGLLGAMAVLVVAGHAEAPSFAAGPTHAAAGERLEQRVDSAGAVTWRALAGTAVVAEGQAAAGEPIEFVAPRVERRVELHIVAQEEGAQLLTSRTLIVYPVDWARPGAKALEGRRIGVLEPAGEAAAALAAMGAKIDRLTGPAALRSYDGDAMVVREAEAAGGAQGWNCPALAFIQGSGEAARAAESLAQGHPALKSLDALDLGGWLPDGSVGKSFDPPPGSRTLLRPEDAPGKALLAEGWNAEGEPVLLCALPVLDRLTSEPVAAALLAAMMKYLAEAPAAESREGLVLLTDARAARKRLAEALGWPAADRMPPDDAAALPAGGVAVLSAEKAGTGWLRLSRPKLWGALPAWVEAGGVLVSAGVDREGLRALAWALGEEAAIGGGEGEIVPGTDEMLWGIGPEPLAGDWGAGVRLTVKSRELVAPGRLWIVPHGAGLVFATTRPLDETAARDLLAPLLVNLGLRPKAEVR